jgi:hypothetical protein
MTLHKQSLPDDQHGTTVHHSCDPVRDGEMEQKVFVDCCRYLVVEDCGSEAGKITMDQQVLAGHCGRLAVEDCGSEA